MTLTKHLCGHCMSTDVLPYKVEISDVRAKNEDSTSSVYVVRCMQCRVTFPGKAYGTVKLLRDGVIEVWRDGYEGPDLIPREISLTELRLLVSVVAARGRAGVQTNSEPTKQLKEVHKELLRRMGLEGDHIGRSDFV